MAEREDDERLAENQEAAAAAAGAVLGSIAGPGGAIAGVWLGPKLKRWVRGVWAELSESARQRQTDVLFWAIREGVPVDEMEARIKASKRTELLTGLALDAAWQTAWDDKLHTLGRSLASGLLAEDDPTIDTEQMIIAAIADIEGPHLAMLELLVRWAPGNMAEGPVIEGPLDSLITPIGGVLTAVGGSTTGSGAAGEPRSPVPTSRPSRRASSEPCKGMAWWFRTITLPRRSRTTLRNSRSS